VPREWECARKQTRRREVSLEGKKGGLKRAERVVSRSAGDVEKAQGKQSGTVDISSLCTGRGLPGKFLHFV